MRSRQLQRRPHVSLTELAFGAGPIGNLYQAMSDEDAHDAVSAAWDTGIRYFDVAPHYGLGLAERRLGTVLRARPRAEFVLSTKIGRLLVPTPETAGRLEDDIFAVPATHRRVWDFSRDGVRRSIGESLERLGLDRIDIALVHDPDDHYLAARDEAIPALIELREEGVVSAIGVGMNQTAALARFVAESDIDVVLSAGRYTLLDHTAADELLPLAVERRVDVIAGSVFNSGLLARQQVPDNATFDYGRAPAAQLSRARSIAALCAEFGTSLPAAAVHFALRHPAVVSVALGMPTADQVHDNAALLDSPPPVGFWDALAGLTR